MNIFLNGVKTCVPENSTIKTLLETNGIILSGVVAELDKKIYTVDEFDIALNENCQLEILSFVGGG